MKKRHDLPIYAACVLLVISPCRIGFGGDESWRRQLASRNVIHLAVDTAKKPVTSVAEIPSYVLGALSKISGDRRFASQSEASHSMLLISKYQTTTDDSFLRLAPRITSLSATRALVLSRPRLYSRFTPTPRP